MKILITGHRGFIGSNLWRHLSTKYDLIGYEWGDEWCSLYDIDYCIHLGAISSTTYTDTRQLLIQNYYFTKKLIDECSMFGVPMAIASSASVYGIDNTTFNENDSLAPTNHYAWSKVMVEEYCKGRAFRNPIHVFRYFNVYGPGEEHKGDQASPYHKFTHQAVESGEIKVFEGSEEFYRDFVPVEYVCKIHEKFLNYSGSGTWNLGTGAKKSFMDVAGEIARKYNSKIVKVPMPEKLKGSYQKYTLADTTKLQDTIKLIETGRYNIL